MYVPRDELFMHALECYLGVYLHRCFVAQIIHTINPQRYMKGYSMGKWWQVFPANEIDLSPNWH